MERPATTCTYILWMQPCRSGTPSPAMHIYQTLGKTDTCTINIYPFMCNNSPISIPFRCVAGICCAQRASCNDTATYVPIVTHVCFSLCIKCEISAHFKFTTQISVSRNSPLFLKPFPGPTCTPLCHTINWSIHTLLSQTCEGLWNALMYHRNTKNSFC